MTSVLYLGCPAAERADTERMLASASVSVVWADTVPNALAELQRRDMPVLLDLSRGADALQTARELRLQRASTLMFAVVDARRPDLTTEAVLAGMADVFARPLGGRRVLGAIDRERRLEAREDQRAPEGVGLTLYAHSPAMRDVAALVAHAAGVRSGVLVRGEPGSGRQFVARAVHDAQPGARRFVQVDCDQDPEALETELFGAGPRSAAIRRELERVGPESSILAAHEGTLYLRNLADAPARVQSRLARVLRDREATLADSGVTVPLDVRPMAGAGPAFDRAVQEGRVRDDLSRRMCAIRIDVPPLRSRREDLPALANYFLREVCGSMRLPPKTLSRPALSLIAALPWRGNGRELRGLLHSVVAGAQGGRGIGLEDVLAHVRLDGNAAVSRTAGTLREARARFEREYIAAILEQHRGRIGDAAKALGIQRTNLYRKMRILRIGRQGRRDA